MSKRVTKLLTAVMLIGAPASALASPRTLASGAPACGNTMGKGGGYKRGCTAEDMDMEEEAQPVIRIATTKGASRAAKVVQNMLDGAYAVKLEPGKTQPMSQLPAIEVALLTIEALPRPRS